MDARRLHDTWAYERYGVITKLTASAWAILEYICYPLLLFLATPYLLRTLGAEGFGYWMLLTATVGFGSVLNAGTGAATIKQVSAGNNHPSNEYIENIISTSLAIALAGGGLLAALILFVFGVAGDVLFSKMGNSSLVLLTGVTAALLTWIEQIDNVFSSALKGAERFGLAAGVEIASKTTQILVAVLAVSIIEEVAALYIGLVFVAIVRVVAKHSIVSRTFGIPPIRPSARNLSEVLHFAKWGWLQGAGGLFFGVADRILIAAMLGASSLAHYSIATQLAMQIHALSAAGFSVLFPKVSRRMELDADFSLVRITRLAMMVNFSTSSALAIGLLLFGENILTWWLGKAEVEAYLSIFKYLIIAYWMLANNVVPYYILLGLGKMKIIGISCMLFGVLSIIIMYAAITTIGSGGTPAGRLAYGAFTLALIYPLMQQIYNKRII